MERNEVPAPIAPPDQIDPRWEFGFCLRCGERNVYARCRYSCPRCGFVMDCSDVFSV